jgi:hypothetical protein
MKLEIRVPLPQTKEHQELPEEAGEDAPLELLEGAWPC